MSSGFFGGRRPVARGVAQAGRGKIANTGAPERAPIVCVFGAPGSGISTILRVLAETLPGAAVVNAHDGDPEMLARRASAGKGVKVVLIDGLPVCGSDENGAPYGADTVQLLYDKRLVFPGSGAVVRVDGPRISTKAGHSALAAWSRALPSVEAHLRMLSLPYFVVQNEPGEDGLAAAVIDLARRTGLA